MSDFKREASKSIIWSAIEKFSVQGVQLILTILIARILLPSDYGLIAMLNVFMAIAQTFVDSGFGNALIQKKNRTAIDFSTVFYFNIIVSTLIYLVLYICAPYIALFYEQPQLDAITKIFGLSLIINSLGIVQQSKLTISLDFKTQAKASFIAIIISGAIGIWMAYIGLGVWSLVWQALANNLFKVILIWYYSKWKPLLAFSKESFKTLFSFGSKLLASSVIHTIYMNLYTLIIGKFFNATTCGLYNQAFRLSTFPSTNITNVIVRAIYPMQCRIQDNDQLLKDMHLKYLRMSCFIIFPIMTVFCALAKPIILLALGEQWIDVIPLLQLLCIAYMLDPVIKTNSTILNVKGRSDYFFKAEIIKKIVGFTILICSIPLGIIYMCAGIILNALFDIAVITYYSNKVIKINIITQLRSIFPILLTSIIIGLVAFYSTFLINDYLLQLIIGIILSLIFYLGIAYICKFQELKYLNRKNLM